MCALPYTGGVLRVILMPILRLIHTRILILIPILILILILKLRLRLRLRLKFILIHVLVIILIPTPRCATTSRCSTPVARR